jgi:hypothetical protein
MKARVFISLIAISMLLLISSDAYGQRQRRAAKEVTITGEVVSVMCYLKDGSRGMGHKECARKCAEKGMPLGILEEAKTEGGRTVTRLYISVGKEHGDPGVSLLMDHIGEKVTVVGIPATRGGVRGIVISSVKKAE